jgi:hypothetical protein
VHASIRSLAVGTHVQVNEKKWYRFADGEWSGEKDISRQVWRGAKDQIKKTGDARYFFEGMGGGDDRSPSECPVAFLLDIIGFN